MEIEYTFSPIFSTISARPQRETGANMPDAVPAAFFGHVPKATSLLLPQEMSCGA